MTGTHQTLPAMVLILTEDASPRHRYIFGYLFSTFLGMDCSFSVPSASHDLPSGIPVISYTDHPVAGAFHVRPQGILSASGIPSAPDMVERSGRLSYFFGSSGADFPFDIFAASFYLLSRAEEYHGDPPDAFGRYHHIHSLAYRHGFLDLPLIDGWMAQFRDALTHRFPSISFLSPGFEFRPGYDIDIAWAYRSRGAVRTLAGSLRSVVSGRFRDVIRRLEVLLGRSPDPYDSYDRLDALHAAYGLHPRYFFLLATKLQGVDRNPDPRSQAVRTLVIRHAKHYPVGMHPSWRSEDDPKAFREEKALLEGLIGGKVTASRQHYLRFQLPDTYRRLISAGITDDHSMGYGAVNGFRASVSRPFPWYDLLAERETPLLVHPFCFMDATAFHELGMSPEEAYGQLEGYLSVIRASGGCMTTIFHNSMLGTWPSHAGWYDMYARFLDRVCDAGCSSSGLLSG